jgi:amino acid transporter
MFSVFGYLGANLLSTPRITFAMAECGDFPSVFGRVHSRFHTPYFSICVFALLAWLLALFGSFTWNVTLSASSRLFYYGLICAALPVLRRKQPDTPRLQIPAGAFVSLLGVLICAGLLTRIDYSKSAIILVAVGVAVVNWLVVRHRQSSDEGMSLHGG